VFELIKIAMAVLTGFIVFKTILFNCNRYVAFVTFALWFRFTLAAFHQFTYDPVVAGLSINALASISIVGFGILVLPKSIFIIKRYVYIYAFIAVIIVSGIYNFRPIDLVNVLVKWGYLLVIASALYLAFLGVGRDKTLLTILKAFYMPVGLMILSILLGESKATENDGSTSYVGGYNHEAAFSMIIVSFTLIVGILRKGVLKFQTSLFFLGVILIVFVNYRTALLTVLPIIFVYVMTATSSKVAPKFRLPLVSIVIIGFFFVFTIISTLMAERFADIGTILSNWQELMKAPVYFTENEQDLFSARVYLWSQYLYEFTNADIMRQTIGHGPEAWSDVFDKYAHNTYVSYLYEYGVLGLSAFMCFIINVLYLALKSDDVFVKYRVAGCFVGYLVMSLATMPIWNIEGLITLALILSIAIYGQFSEKTTKANKRSQLAGVGP
jgi:hypothetical protein